MRKGQREYHLVDSIYIILSHRYLYGEMKCQHNQKKLRNLIKIIIFTVSQ